jgi:type VI secretion system protein VasD
MVTLCSACSFNDKEATYPSRVTYSLNTSDNVNPNLRGDGTAIELQIFELEDDSMFLSADYESLVTNAKKNLKSNYLEHKDFVLLPGQFKFIEYFELHQDTRFIGVMGRYAHPESAQWKKLVQVKARDKTYHMMIMFDDSEVKLKIVE